jgi:hypothetical protein
MIFFGEGEYWSSPFFFFQIWEFQNKIFFLTDRYFMKISSYLMPVWKLKKNV